MNWRAQTEEIAAGRKYRLQKDDVTLSFRELIRLLEADAGFAAWYSRLLATAEFDAYYWEHPPLTLESIDRDAEFVLIEARTLGNLAPEPAPFRSQFDDQPDADVISFPNLGGDAMLVVPRPIAPLDAYPHLAAFVRQAPERQVLALWRLTARTVYQNVTSTPKWLSTAGLGVAWLHIRLDTRPKYYNYAPYTQYPFQ